MYDLVSLDIEVLSSVEAINVAVPFTTGLKKRQSRELSGQICFLCHLGDVNCPVLEYKVI